MSAPCTVVIGAPQFLDALRERAGAHGEVLSFADHDALRALEAITAHQPKVVSLERLFAATSRGAALINRIKADPSMASTEIHVVSHDGSYSRVSPRRPMPAPAAGTTAAASTVAAAPADPAVPLDYRGTRRAPRYRLAAGTEAQIDGAAAGIIDLSVMGAQITTASALRPLQRLRVTLSDGDGVVRCHAAVAWASFEVRESGARYRAGIEFTDAEAAEVEAFRQRHQAG